MSFLYYPDTNLAVQNSAASQLSWSNDVVYSYNNYNPFHLQLILPLYIFCKAYLYFYWILYYFIQGFRLLYFVFPVC